MSSETLQRQFNEYAERILRIAYRAFLQENDTSILENFHLQNLITLISKCYQVQQIYNTQAITVYLRDIEYIEIKLVERIQFLNHDHDHTTTSSPIKRFVKKVQTGERPKFIINIEAVKLLRE